MKDAMDYAKFFLKQEDPSIANTYDGNMKLQKLLALADIISYARFNKPLFQEPVLAYENGFVVENVRQRYKNDYYGLKKDSDIFNPDFTEDEYQILNDTLGIFGKLSARELSDISHEFPAWGKALDKGRIGTFHDKESSAIDFASATADISKMRDVLESYDSGKTVSCRKEVINGCTFHIPNEIYSDDLMKQLELFRRECPEDSYAVLYDNGELVVY